MSHRCMDTVHGVPLDIREWRVYYADGTVYTSADGAWEDAPREGVLAAMAVLEAVHRGRHVLWKTCGYDYYWRDPRTGLLGSGNAPHLAAAGDVVALEAGRLGDDYSEEWRKWRSWFLELRVEAG